MISKICHSWCKPLGRRRGYEQNQFAFCEVQSPQGHLATSWPVFSETALSPFSYDGKSRLNTKNTEDQDYGENMRIAFLHTTLLHTLYTGIMSKDDSSSVTGPIATDGVIRLQKAEGLPLNRHLARSGFWRRITEETADKPSMNAISVSPRASSEFLMLVAAQEMMSQLRPPWWDYRSQVLLWFQFGKHTGQESYFGLWKLGMLMICWGMGHWEGRLNCHQGIMKERIRKWVLRKLLQGHRRCGG